MDNANTGRVDLDEHDADARFQQQIGRQFHTFMERMLETVPQPRAGGGPDRARMMKTQVEKLTNLKQFPSWDVRLDIAAQFSGCRQEIYGVGDADADTNQGFQLAIENRDQNRELVAKDLLTRAMDTSILALVNPRVSDAFTIYRTLYSVYKMDCDSTREHDEVYLATLKLSSISPPTIQNLMKEINQTSEKLITSGTPVDDNKKLSTLKRAVKQDKRFNATVESFRAMRDLTFVSACSILMFVEKEQESDSEIEPEEKKEETINVSTHSDQQSQSQTFQNTAGGLTFCHRCDQPGHAHFNCPYRFQIQQLVSQLAHSQSYGSTNPENYFNSTRHFDGGRAYGSPVSGQQFLRGRRARGRNYRGRYQHGRFQHSPAIHTMMEAPMHEYGFESHGHAESHEEDASGVDEEQNLAYIN